MTAVPAKDGRSRTPSALSTWPELALVLLMLVITAVSGSLTLFGETIRTALTAIAARWVPSVRHRSSRGRMEFGVGKLEQAGNLAIASALIVAGFGVTARAFWLILTGESEATPQGLALAATTYALLTIRNGLSVVACCANFRQGVVSTDQTLRRSRLSRFVISLSILAIMTAAGMIRDPVIGLWMDAVGALFAALLMVTPGVRIFWEAMTDLIDHPLDNKSAERINRTLSGTGVTAPELFAMRSRRSGPQTFVELTLAPEHTLSLQEIRQRLARIRPRLERAVEGLDVVIILNPNDDVHMPE